MQILQHLKEVDGENTFPGHPDRSRHRSGSCLPLLHRLETCDLLVCGSDADRDCDILKQEQEYGFQVHQREGQVDHRAHRTGRMIGDPFTFTVKRKGNHHEK